jgi:hypothetical protein
LFNTHPSGDEVGLIHLPMHRVQRFQTHNTTGYSAFSPDGRQLAFHSASDLMIGPVGDLTVASAVYTHPAYLSRSVAWHPNRPWLASAARVGQLGDKLINKIPKLGEQ